MNDSDKPDGDDPAKEPPKIKAEDNPWYLLATLYGLPGLHAYELRHGHELRSNHELWHELRKKNRIAWNRYFAAELDEGTRKKLIEENRHPAEELTPFSPDELEGIEIAFGERCKVSGHNVPLPKSSYSINFQNVQFDSPVTFEGFLLRDCWFADAVFQPGFHAHFEAATFIGSARFTNATFHAKAYFKGANFRETFPLGREVDFSGARFVTGAFFDEAAFGGQVYFNGTSFLGETRFMAASFSHKAEFRDTAFSARTYFNGALFSWAEFSHARFDDGVYFDAATFTGETNFIGSIFGAQSSFVNAKMKYDTSFESALLEREPPRFFGAELHDGTNWDAKKWPLPPAKERAKQFVDSYACLKREMDRLKKHEDELDFFAVELQSRRVLLGPWKGLPIAMYGLLSDYGRSYLRPLLALVGVVAFGTLALLLSNRLSPWQPLEPFGLSLANTLNVFGFRKDFFEPATIQGLPAVMEVVAAVQSILGTILLFLAGLGIRNKFRMK
jgi:uncharacterized protein YjbI with pentapeptide repeats